jgi:hypothetical protein
VKKRGGRLLRAVGERLWWAVQSLMRTCRNAPMSLFRTVHRRATSLFRSVRRRIISFGHGVCRIPGQVLRSPVATYRRVLVFRDWFLAKVEYLQGESQKWRTLFGFIRLPYSALRGLGLSPNAALTLLFAGSVAGTGVVASETVFSERSFSRGDAGTYSAPLDAPVSYTDGDNTLRLVLGTVPVREITIENVSVNVHTGSALPTGETTAILVGGTDVAEGTDTVLEIGELLIEKIRCKSMDFSNIVAHTVKIIGNASDGLSINQTAGLGRMRAIGGGHHQAEAMVTSGGTYDRIHIDAPTSAVNGKIDKLTLRNIYSRGGACTFERMEVGTLTIQLNEAGHDGDFSTKEFSIAATVTGANHGILQT